MKLTSQGNRVRLLAWAAVSGITMVCLAGCTVAEPQFGLNAEDLEPGEIGPKQQQVILSTLQQLFGTPNRSKVPRGVNLNLELLERAAGGVYSDEQGNRWGLYRQHCARCHGISGDGAGPTAAMLNPYPRDFRRGTFKYTSTAGGAKPSADDLRRALSVGNADTAMPSFVLLPAHEIDALVEYVKYLSIRGETELYLIEENADSYYAEEVREDLVLAIAAMWDEAEQMVVQVAERPPRGTPDELAASIARGRELYLSEAARCSTCHGPKGDGRGEQMPLYDDWNKPKLGMRPQQTRELARRFRLPLQELPPRDFTRGIYRGGDDPRDIYWRIHVGIKGTPMPAHGPAPGTPGVLKPEQIWDVVNYVLSLSGRGQ